MVEALVACGWAYGELIQCRTRLLDGLKCFIDIDKRRHENVERAVRLPSPGSSYKVAETPKVC